MNRSLKSVVFITTLLAQPGCQNKTSHPWDDPTSLVEYMASTVAERDMESRTEVEIVQALAIAGKPELALQLIQSSDFVLPASALQRMVAALSESEDLRPLVNAARKIEDPGDRTTALCYIAKGYVKRDERKIASEILVEAEEANREVSYEHIATRNLIDIAESLLAIDENERALAALSEVREQNRNLSSITRVDWCRLTAELYAQAEDPESALEILEEAAQVTEKIDSEMFYFPAVEAIAVEYAKIGEIEKAQEFTAEIEDADTKAGALAGIAAVLLEVDKTAQALELLHSSVEIIEQSEYPFYRVEVYCEISSAYAAAKQTKRANDALKAALKLAATIDDPEEKTTRLQLVAQTSIELGEQDLALSALQQAAEIALTIDDPPSRAGDLLEVISSLILVGQHERAQTLLKPAREAAHQSGSAFVLDEFLKSISTLWARAGDPEKSFSVISTISSRSTRVEALWDLTVMLAFEDGDKIVAQDNEYPHDRLANQRLKKSFTKEEQRLAQKIVEALPKEESRY